MYTVYCIYDTYHISCIGGKSFYGKDLSVLQMDAYTYDDMIRIKIYDPNAKRYEVMSVVDEHSLHARAKVCYVMLNSC